MMLFQDFKRGKNLLTQRHQFRATFCTRRSLSNSWLHRWTWRLPERCAQITHSLLSLGSHKTKETLRAAKKGDKGSGLIKPFGLCPVAMLMLPVEQIKLLFGTASGIQTSTNSRTKFHDVNKKSSPYLEYMPCFSVDLKQTTPFLFGYSVAKSSPDDPKQDPRCS